MPEINSMEFLHLKVSRFLSAERVGGWESAFVGFLGNSRYCRSTRFLRRKAHRKFTWNIVCQVFAIFGGGCIFSGRGVHFLFLFFLKEKVSYIRYHEAFSGVSWLTSTHPAWVVSPPVSATKRFGKTFKTHQDVSLGSREITNHQRFHAMRFFCRITCTNVALDSHMFFVFWPRL